MQRKDSETPTWVATLAAVCPLFHGIAAEDLGELMLQLNAHRRKLSKGEAFLRAGEKADKFGVVLSGTLVVASYGVDGRRTIVHDIGTMQPVALAQAFSPEHTMRVGVEADGEATVLVLRVDRIISPQEHATRAHLRLTYNLMSSLAAKTLELSHKLAIVSHRSTADRLLAFLRGVAHDQGTNEFDIPFDRQQLADFLCVERSALSAEIGRLTRLGVLTSRKRHFSLNKTL